MKVTIKSKLTNDKWGWYEETEVFVDGVSIGTGSYQGEPEDRSRSRDFSWVEPLLFKLAKALGAEVELEVVDET